MNLVETIKKMRAIGAPVVAVDTVDQMSTAQVLRTGLNGESPLVLWDCAKGLQAFNEKGEQALGPMLASLSGAAPNATKNPLMALAVMEKAPSMTIVIMLNFDRFLGDVGVLQSVMNLRDQFKGDNRVLVMFGVEFKLPAALKADVLKVEEKLPTPEEVRAIVAELFEQNEIKHTSEDLDYATDALRGLSGFAVEQAAAMAIMDGGAINREAMWDRKIQAINEIDGLKMVMPKERKGDLGGCGGWWDFMNQIANGPERPSLIVLFDEFEKQIAGAGGENSQGDTSGVSQDAVGLVLRNLEDHKQPGMTHVGPAGCSKTHGARVLAGELGCPLIEYDFGAMKGSLVGESEAKARRAQATINALAGDGRVLYIATVNSTANLSTPMRRRLGTYGFWFFDLPDADERAKIGTIQAKAFKVDDDETFWLVDAAGWSGANVRDCCRLAHAMKASVKEAARKVIATAAQNPEALKELRNQAQGKYLAAPTGEYYIPPTGQADKPLANRKIKLGQAS